MTLSVPAVTSLQTSDRALASWASTVAAAFNALRNAGVLTQADVDKMMRDSVRKLSDKRAATGEDVLVDMGGGITGSVPIETLASKLLNYPRFAEALKKAATAATSSAAQSTQATDVDVRLSEEIQTQLADLNAATEAADAAAEQANQALQMALGRLAAASRGPIVAVGVLGYWDATQAARCVYWMALNGGTGGAPTFPTNINDYLVVGDRVVLRSTGTDPATFMDSRQWLGPAIGWVATPHSTSFHDVINLDGFLANAATVIPASGQVSGSATITGTGRTLTQLAGSYRAPYITYAHVGGATGFPAALDADIASWVILYLLNGSVNPGYRTPMPTAFLVYGDTVTFIDDSTSSNIGALSWNGSAWT